MLLTHYFVYIIRCENNHYYTGYTTDLTRRLKEHFSGSPKCKYTRSFKALNLAQSWKITGKKAQAMRIERYIKTLSRVEKESLIANPNRLAHYFVGLLNSRETLLIKPFGKL
ncbi:MAG: GIY-YIG nuclease family protein [Gammaproteobacteria bacterium]|nr:GIY-YIG nuclease family protein [Gammaproteobacteria bacterium]